MVVSTFKSPPELDPIVYSSVIDCLNKNNIPVPTVAVPTDHLLTGLTDFQPLFEAFIMAALEGHTEIERRLLQTMLHMVYRYSYVRSETYGIPGILINEYKHALLQSLPAATPSNRIAEYITGSTIKIPLWRIKPISHTPEPDHSHLVKIHNPYELFVLILSYVQERPNRQQVII